MVSAARRVDQAALAILRIEGEEPLGENQLQDGVPEKLQPLVAFRAAGVVLQVGRVRDGPDQQFRLAEGVAQVPLQGGQRGETGASTGFGGNTMGRSAPEGKPHEEALA